MPAPTHIPDWFTAGVEPLASCPGCATLQTLVRIPLAASYHHSANLPGYCHRGPGGCLLGVFFEEWDLQGGGGAGSSARTDALDVNIDQKLAGADSDKFLRNRVWKGA